MKMVNALVPGSGKLVCVLSFHLLIQIIQCDSLVRSSAPFVWLLSNEVTLAISWTSFFVSASPTLYIEIIARICWVRVCVSDVDQSKQQEIVMLNECAVFGVFEIEIHVSNSRLAGGFFVQTASSIASINNDLRIIYYVIGMETPTGFIWHWHRTYCECDESQSNKSERTFHLSISTSDAVCLSVYVCAVHPCSWYVWSQYNFVAFGIPILNFE